MSLAIQVDDIRRVMIGGEWLGVDKDERGVGTFLIDSYEYLHGETMLLGGGDEDMIPARGFGFRRAGAGTWVAGPLSAIQAVEYE